MSARTTTGELPLFRPTTRRPGKTLRAALVFLCFLAGLTGGAAAVSKAHGGHGCATCAKAR